MLKYYESLPRKKEAVQFTNSNINQLINALPGYVKADMENGTQVLKVKTVHGEIAIVRVSDWIVKDANPGTYYPIKEDIFHRDHYANTCFCPPGIGYDLINDKPICRACGDEIGKKWDK